MRKLPLLALPFLAAACLDHTPLDETGQLTSFVALQRDFDGFTGWTKFELGDLPAQAGDGHPAGPRTVYVNMLPEPGSTRFPVGTMIVKTRGDGSPQTWEVHGMVKRGSGYNPTGAVGWEWFDLLLDDRGSPVIIWRGTEAPSGHGYGSLIGGGDDTIGTSGDCNSCHGAARTNDSVLTPGLVLSEL